MWDFLTGKTDEVGGWMNTETGDLFFDPPPPGEGAVIEGEVIQVSDTVDVMELIAVHQEEARSEH